MSGIVLVLIFVMLALLHRAILLVVASFRRVSTDLARFLDGRHGSLGRAGDH